MSSHIEIVDHIIWKCAGGLSREHPFSDLIPVEVKFWGHIQFKDIWSIGFLCEVHHWGEDQVVQLCCGCCL